MTQPTWHNSDEQAQAQPEHPPHFPRLYLCVCVCVDKARVRSRVAWRAWIFWYWAKQRHKQPRQRIQLGKLLPWLTTCLSLQLKPNTKYTSPSTHFRPRPIARVLSCHQHLGATFVQPKPVIFASCKIRCVSVWEMQQRVVHTHALNSLTLSFARSLSHLLSLCRSFQLRGVLLLPGEL